MANTPAWFNKDYYLTSKLAQLRAAGETKYNNIVDVAVALEAAGFTAYEHFQQYSLIERTSPNPAFNATEYLNAKAAQLGNGATADSVALAIREAGMNLWEHFQTYGWKEGVNPSNSFDVKKYMESKLAQLQKAEPGAGWTAEKLEEAFSNAGIDPVSHYDQFGKNEEGVEVSPATNPVPSDDRTDGQTFTLTTGVDTWTGTAGNDTIIGTQGGATSTFNTADSIDGGAGIDTLAVAFEGTAAGTLNAASVKNVEIISVRNVGATAGGTGVLLTVDGTNFVGATEFVSDRSSSAVKFDNIGKADVTVVGNGAVTNGDVTISAAAAGSVTDAFVLNLKDGTKGASAIVVNDAQADWTEATINSTGAANTVGAVNLSGAGAAGADHTIKTLTINAATNLTTGAITGFDTGATVTNTIKVNGAATSVNIGAVAGAIDVLDASGLTAGGLTATLANANHTKIKVTGGAGNDVITVDSLQLLKADGAFVDAGAGTADRLVLTAALPGTTAANKEAAALFKNFEELQVNNGVLQDAALFTGSTIGAIRISAGTAANTGVTNLSAAQAANVTVLAGVTTVASDFIQIGVKDATVTGNIDTVKITVDNGVATDNATVQKLGSLDLAGVEKLEVTGVDAWSITDLTKATDIDSIVIKGAAASSLTLGTVNLAINSSIDATAATGTVTIDASAAQAGAAAKGLAIKGATAAVNDIKDSKQADVITGGDKADVVTYTGGADVVTLGKGGDTFTFSSSNDGWTAQGGTAAGTGGVIFKFVAGDSISKAGATNGVDATVTDKIEGVSGAAYASGAGHRFILDTDVTATAVKADGAAVVFGTTTVTNAGDFYVYVASTTSAFVYQDSDGNGKIDAGDFAIEIVGANLTASDFTFAGGNLVFQGAA